MAKLKLDDKKGKKVRVKVGEVKRIDLEVKPIKVELKKKEGTLKIAASDKDKVTKLQQKLARGKKKAEQEKKAKVTKKSQKSQIKKKSK